MISNKVDWVVLLEGTVSLNLATNINKVNESVIKSDRVD